MSRCWDSFVTRYFYCTVQLPNDTSEFPEYNKKLCTYEYFKSICILRSVVIWQRIVLFYFPVKQESVCQHKTAVTVVNQARESFQFWAEYHPHYSLFIISGVVSSYIKRIQPSENFPSIKSHFSARNVSYLLITPKEMKSGYRVVYPDKAEAQLHIIDCVVSMT